MIRLLHVGSCCRLETVSSSTSLASLEVGAVPNGHVDDRQRPTLAAVSELGDRAVRDVPERAIEVAQS